jgi:hypothetical protein
MSPRSPQLKRSLELHDEQLRVATSECRAETGMEFVQDENATPPTSRSCAWISSRFEMQPLDARLMTGERQIYWTGPNALG